MIIITYLVIYGTDEYSIYYGVITFIILSFLFLLMGIYMTFSLPRIEKIHDKKLE